jgi:glycosyltransferase involved in cell wall biosynthesis
MIDQSFVTTNLQRSISDDTIHGASIHGSRSHGDPSKADSDPPTFGVGPGNRSWFDHTIKPAMRITDSAAPTREPRRRGGPGAIDACTIIAGNYLAAARVLAESFFAHHPEGSFTVLLVDDEHEEIVPASEIDHRIEWWRLADLGLDRAEIHRLAGIYDVAELSTSVKPLFLQLLMRAREAAVIYLDPDIRLFGSLAYVPLLADRHGLVLTPHMTRPIPDDGRQIDALFVLAAGVYNLGFAGVAPASAPCLDWWWQQTRRRALIDVERQMFTDQRWADYMPSLFSHHLLKDPGYNVAYWNLHERPLTRVHGRFYARNLPLRFFHFSGFNPRMPWLLSRHQGERPRILLSECPVLASLCDDYAAALDRAGFNLSSQRPYGWDVSTDGLAMTGRIRRLYWSALIAAEGGAIQEPPDPFDPARPGAFTAWLNAPDERGPRRWSRYLREIYQARADLRAHIQDIDGTGAARFGHWMRTDGVVQEKIPPALAPAAAVVDKESLPARDRAESARAHGLNVVGYFHAELGVGEAARLLTRAIDATGTPYVTTLEGAPHSRQHHRFETGDAAAGSPFDINLLCVNADRTPALARDSGRASLDRHTIGYWFWEVDPLPAGMHGAFDHVDEVWTATDYVAGIVRSAAAGRTPVFTVPLPLAATAPSPAVTREQLGLPTNRFVFLFVFDFLSVMSRKNPLGAIEAFCAAFAPGEGALLVLKSINGDARVSELEQLRRAAAHRSDIEIRDGYLSADEKNGLLAACDCYVSLHRAEGLGLTLAEAMALGKPAVATGYSGNCHFMTDENSFLVGYRLTDVADDCGPYPPGARWAEPDLRHAAQLMRNVYLHPGEAKRRGECGRADLLRHHGVTSSASAIADRLASIRRARAAAATEIPADTARGIDAIDAFAAALPQLRQLGEPRLSYDERSWQWLRRAAQRAMFRVIRPYWFQQRQFQDALLKAVLDSLERPAAPDPVRSDRPAGRL